MNKLLLLASIPVLFPATTFATPNGALETAKSVKAIYDKGFVLPAVVDIEFANQTGKSIPCVMVIYERKLNTICPDDPMIGPNLDKGYAVCFNPVTREVDSVTAVRTPDCY